MIWIRSRFSFVLILSFSGCSSAPPIQESDSLKQVYAEVCSFGATHQRVEGRVDMKVSSPQASGRFPAEVVATAPGSLQMEVLNLLGGTEAVIQIQGQKMQIKTPQKDDKKSRTIRASDTWGGLPLAWGADLFLGRVPCPKRLSGIQLEFQSSDPKNLQVTVKRLGKKIALFEYTLRKWNNAMWTERLVWTRLGREAQKKSHRVQFEFSHPNRETGSALRWSAESSRGHVRVRWRKRSVSSH